jgi:ribosomal protein L37AE/L43A
MRRPSVGSPAASRVEEIVCPDCGCGWLQPRGFLSRLAECDRCGRAFDKTIVGTLEQIVALPRALGKHPCECGHPEMRRLPDGVFHCPACRAEVLPASNRVPERLRRGDCLGHSRGSRPALADQRRKCAAFGLMLSLIWIYVYVLRLIALLRSSE